MALIHRAAAVGLVLLVSIPALASPGRATFLQSVVVDEAVDGDVVSLGGDVVLGPNAHVRGHVVAVFGEVHADERARIEGRALTVGSLASLQMDDARGSDAAATAGARLLAAGLWLLVTTVLASVLPGWVRRAANLMPQLGARIAVMGALGILTVFAALVAVLAIGGSLGVAAATLVMLVFLAAKACGLAVLGGALGAALAERLWHRVAPMPLATFVGVACLLPLRFIPVVGELAWSLVAIVALGAGLLAVLVTAWDDRLAAAVVRPGP